MPKDKPPTRTITPHKGGRTIKKSADVTPETEARLGEAKEKYGLSLGDLIALIAENYETVLVTVR